MKKLSEKFTTFSQDFKNVHREAKKQGFVNIMKLLWKDLFVGRTAFQWRSEEHTSELQSP